jgi:hypothetical protein
MFSDAEDPLSWEEKFGNFNLTQFNDCKMTRPPSRVLPVKRLKGDVLCMRILTESEEASDQSVRPGKRAQAIYGFGDAREYGFGVSIEIEGKGIVWCSGTWSLSMREESSNFRELWNLVEIIEDLVKDGTLSNHEIILFMNNLSAEAAFCKGTSTSKNLFEPVLRLRKFGMKGALFLHLVHISRASMIWSGVDRLSRGDHNAGVMVGNEMLSFVPLSQNTAEHSAGLLPWVRTWASPKQKSKQVKRLSPTENGVVHTQVERHTFGCRLQRQLQRRSSG